MTTTNNANGKNTSATKAVQANPANNTAKSTPKATSTTTKKVEKVEEKVVAKKLEKTTGRNFYATKPDKSGKEIAYAFERVAERSEWMGKNDDAKPVTALEVYQMLNKHDTEALIANRNKRVYKIKADEEIEVKKGQRLIRC